MSECWIVTQESGEWSYWTRTELAAFTTRERAVEWLESQEFPVERGCTGGYEDTGYAVEIVCAYATPTTTDGKTWMLRKTIDGYEVERWSSGRTWFVVPLRLDPDAGVRDA